MLTVVKLVKYVDLSTESVFEGQNQTSEGKQKQHHGGKIKWLLVSKI